MRLKKGKTAAWALITLVSGLAAGCSPDTGLELLARTAAGMSEAWCRHADNCYPPCDAEPGGPEDWHDRGEPLPRARCARR